MNGPTLTTVLDSLIAFTATMLTMAIIVSVFVEMINRMVGLRQTGLKRLLEAMYDEIRDKIVGPEPANTTRGSERARFLVEMLNSPMLARLSPASSLERERSKGPLSKWKRVLRAFTLVPRALFGFIVGDRVGSLTTAEFLQRLAAGSLGNEISTKLNNVETAIKSRVLDDIVRRYEAYGSEVTLWFQRWARLISVLVGLVLAVALHVDVLTMIYSFARDPALRAAVIAAAPQIQADARARTDQATGAGAQDNNDPAADARRALLQMQQSLERLSGAGVSLGWTDANSFLPPVDQVPSWLSWATPYVTAPTRPGEPPALRTLSFRVPNTWANVFGIILGGVLIGLGAPFWFSAVKNLTNLRQTAGGIIDGLSGQRQVANGAGPAGLAVTPDIFAKSQVLTLLQEGPATRDGAGDTSVPMLAPSLGALTLGAAPSAANTVFSTARARLT